MGSCWAEPEQAGCILKKDSFAEAKGFHLANTKCHLQESGIEGTRSHWRICAPRLVSSSTVSDHSNCLVKAEDKMSTCHWRNYGRSRGSWKPLQLVVMKKLVMLVFTSCGRIPNDLGALLLQRTFNGELAYVESFTSTSTFIRFNTGT